MKNCNRGCSYYDPPDGEAPARANNTRAGTNNCDVVLGYDHSDTIHDIKTNGSPPYDHPNGDLIICPPGSCNEKLLLWVFIL